MPDTVKLRLIDDLEDFLGDTSMTYAKVRSLSNHYYTYGKKMPMSTSYNLQVDAMILINYIAFSS